MLSLILGLGEVVIQNKVRTCLYFVSFFLAGNTNYFKFEGFAFAKRADAIFHHMLSLEERNLIFVDNISFSSCINAWCKYSLHFNPVQTLTFVTIKKHAQEQKMDFQK